jgi:hypothetical protein
MQAARQLVFPPPLQGARLPGTTGNGAAKGINPWPAAGAGWRAANSARTPLKGAGTRGLPVQKPGVALGGNGGCACVATLQHQAQPKQGFVKQAGPFILTVLSTHALARGSRRAH